MRFWHAKTYYATHDRQYWTTRKVSCSACGYDAKHYLAEVVLLSDGRPVLTVPWAGLNGGTGEELDWPFDDNAPREGTTVYLSQCCDYPRFVVRALARRRDI